MQLRALQSFCFSSFCPLTQPSSPDIQNPWEVSHSSSGEGEEASPTFHLISWGDCPPSKSCRKIHAFRRRPTGALRQQSCTLQAGEPSSCANSKWTLTLTEVSECKRVCNLIKASHLTGHSLDLKPRHLVQGDHLYCSSPDTPRFLTELGQPGDRPGPCFGRAPIHLILSLLMKHMDIVFKSHIILLELSLGQFLPIPYPHSLEATIFKCFFWYLFPCCQIIGWDWCLLICFSILDNNYWLLDIRVEDPSMCALSLSPSSIDPMWLDYLFCLNKYSICTWIWLRMAQSWAV